MLSARLLEFVRGFIRSVWAVELLLILRRDQGATWSQEELVRELRGSRGLVREILEGFETSGIAQEVSSGRYAYRPTTDLIEQLCQELETEYRKRPVTVMNAVVLNERTNIQKLADAFRFRDK